METVLFQSDYEIERNKPIPSKNHAIVQGNIHFLLRQRYGHQYRVMPEVSIIIDGKERIPDIAVYPPMEFTPGNDEVWLSEIPLTTIEILSPQQHLADLIAKSYKYFDAGVKSYWLVLPDLRTVYVFSAPNEYEVYSKTGTLRDPKIGVELIVEEIFQ